jgi:hypothetical protein
VATQDREARVTRRCRLFSVVFLVGLVSTNAYAQDDLLWQHAEGRRAIWTMVGTTMSWGDLIKTVRSRRLAVLTLLRRALRPRRP